MSIPKTIAQLTTTTLVALSVIALLITLGSIIGGIVGITIATGYNMIFGASLEIIRFAAIGSVITVLGASVSAET